jgi:hypothetical protein
MRSLKALALLALVAAPPASAFTMYNAGEGGARANIAGPEGAAHALPNERGAGAARNHVSIYSGVMPGTHQTLPPPAALFKTSKPKTAKAARTARYVR